MGLKEEEFMNVMYYTLRFCFTLYADLKGQFGISRDMLFLLSLPS